MKDRKIEEHLSSAINEMTPDLLENLVGELKLEEGVRESHGHGPAERAGEASAENPAPVKGVRRVPFDTKRKKRRRLYQGMAGCAAAFLLFLGGYGLLFGEKEAAAVIGLDVNPSIELSVDDRDRVIAATAYNDEGKEILGDLDFEGSDIDVACNAVVGAMLTRGFLTDLSNSILVSVQAQDEEHGKMLEKSLSQGLNGYLEDTKIAAAILGQYVKSDEELTAFARENGISPGKAWLIRSLAAKDERMTEESLLKLSTQELILLGQEKKISGDDSYGQVNTSEYITREEALLIGAEAAGLTAAGETDPSAVDQLMEWHRVTFECDDGVIIYDVDFAAEGVEYEYDIHAKTGEIIDQDRDNTDSGSGSGGSGGTSGSGSGGGQGSGYDDDDRDDDSDDRDDDSDDRNDRDDDSDYDRDYDRDDDDGYAAPRTQTNSVSYDHDDGDDDSGDRDYDSDDDGGDSGDDDDGGDDGDDDD